MQELTKSSDIKKKLTKYVPIEIVYNKKVLSDEDAKVLEKLIEASRLVDNIFWEQSYKDGLNLKKELEKSKSPEDRDYLHFLKINYGPFDIQEEYKPFIGTKNKPLGANFYPEDLTKKEFDNYIKEHPELREDFESHYTVIKRKDGKLVTVPYNIEYKDNLQKIAQVLREASEITSNSYFKRYLIQKAQDLLNNDYYRGDCEWIDLKDNLVEISIGPFEVYEDRLNGIKTAYQSHVYINNFAENKKIESYLNYLNEMQENLPVAEKYKPKLKAGLKSPLNVVHEVFAAGWVKAGPQASAFVLPNDEKVREEKGTKKIFLKNIMEAKFNNFLTPLSQRVIQKNQLDKVSFFSYFNDIIMHEISHALGVNYIIMPDGTKTTVNNALKDNYSTIEEAKADIVGLYNIDFLIKNGLLPRGKEEEHYTTFLAGIFRQVRFGMEKAHGLSALLQYNYFKERGAFIYDGKGRFSVNYEKIKPAIKDMTKELLVLEGNGDYARAREFVLKYKNASAEVKKTIKRLEDLPIDIEPIFNFKAK